MKKCFYNFYISIIFLIDYIIFLPINCRVIIPFKYLQEKPSVIPTPKEILSSYMNEKIYITIELGSPKQEVQIPLRFNENMIYILNQENSINNNITNKIYDDSKSKTFKRISEDMEYDYEYGYSMYQMCSDNIYFLKNKGKKYNKKEEISFRQIYDGKSGMLGGFGLQIYPEKNGDESKMPCPLKI